ncbi:Stk1 family PASTA domain-containing Ser/Thr kinase [Specibacter sp. RAF43]|uniref:Stk1 family PASTA domain-containing Ser/Thr kinase n=1 Tax=Specibacter sp. RAF43 TaxID=3233057 RepID=UPI003F996A77
MNIPRVLNGRYEIGELLGRGGMADVYKALDTRLDRMVAIKVLRGDVARDTQLQARFRREAQAVAGLNHPSIVAVYDTGEHPSEDPLQDGARLPYIVMEYVHGQTLRELIRADEIGIDRAIEYTLGVLSALEYSHRAGIVHRDIKPANVMVTADASRPGRLGTVKVMDFGIARTMSDTAATMTQTQTVMGTAQYLSPEQARGEAVDARSDLYSTACLFYEMVAGRPPFTGDSPVSVAYQHVREVPPPASKFNRDVSAAVDSVLLRALQKDRADRFQDAAAFRRALRAARTGVTLAPAAAASLPTELVTTVAAPAPAPFVGSPAAPAVPEPRTTPLDGDGPATRAMAKVLAGGALIRDDADLPEVPVEPDRRVKRRRRAWIATLFVFLALILAGGGVFGYMWLSDRPAAPVPVTVPVLANVSEEEALAQLSSLGLDPKPVEEFSTDVDAGNVIRTDPHAGVQVNPHTVIDVFVSKGPSEVTIPKDIAGRTESEVRAELAALNLAFKPNDFVTDPQIQANLVVTTDPAPGTSVPVGTEVTLKISNGQVDMPSLFDLTKDPAQVKKAVEAALTKASPTLAVVFEEAENTAVAPGMVMKQSVSAGTRVAQRTTITVTLAKAPAVEPPSDGPTPTEEPDNSGPSSAPKP